MYNPKEVTQVVLDGHSLTLETFVAVARYGATVELADSALEAMKKSRALAEKIIEEAKNAGYSHMFLDTVPVLADAVRLYRKMGFYETECYNDSPVETTLFMEYDL